MISEWPSTRRAAKIVMQLACSWSRTLPVSRFVAPRAPCVPDHTGLARWRFASAPAPASVRGQSLERLLPQLAALDSHEYETGPPANVSA